MQLVLDESVLSSLHKGRNMQNVYRMNFSSLVYLLIYDVEIFSQIGKPSIYNNAVKSLGTPL